MSTTILDKSGVETYHVKKTYPRGVYISDLGEGEAVELNLNDLLDALNVECGVLSFRKDDLSTASRGAYGAYWCDGRRVADQHARPEEVLGKIKDLLAVYVLLTSPVQPEDTLAAIFSEAASHVDRKAYAKALLDSGKITLGEI